MDRVLDAAEVRPKGRDQRPNLYPLQRPFIAGGLLAALIVGSVFFSPLAWFAFLVAFVVVGALWPLIGRRGRIGLVLGFGEQWNQKPT